MKKKNFYFLLVNKEHVLSNILNFKVETKICGDNGTD